MDELIVRFVGKGEGGNKKVGIGAHLSGYEHTFFRDTFLINGHIIDLRIRAHPFPDTNTFRNLKYLNNN